MKRESSKSQQASSATGQNRCIWMTAGVISFKLCPLDYDCEHCDFDQVMRSRVKFQTTKPEVKRQRLKAPPPSERISDSEVESKKALFFTFSLGKVKENLHLHPTHLWVRPLNDLRWRVGIGKLLAYVLPPPIKIELHRQNTKVTQNKLIGKIHTQGGTIPLFAPLSGHLLEINSKLDQCPELAQRDPEGEGWLATMEASPDTTELGNLHLGPEVRKFLEEEAQHLNFLLKHRGIEVDNIGVTLPDGGVNIKYLHQVLPNQVCLGLAGELIISGRQAW